MAEPAVTLGLLYKIFFKLQNSHIMYLYNKISLFPAGNVDIVCELHKIYKINKSRIESLNNDMMNICSLYYYLYFMIII